MYDFDEEPYTLDRFNRPLEIYQEASQSKKATERRNYNKNLEMIDYDPSTKTMSMEGINGQKTRVIVNINGSKFLDDPLARKLEVPREDSHRLDDNIYMQAFDFLPWVNIPPKMLKREPKNLLPLIRHETEHANQFVSGKRTYRRWKQAPVDEEGYPDLKNLDYLKNSKEVVEYTKKFIEKHKHELNEHDQKVTELLADLAAAKKYGLRQLKKSAYNYIELSAKKNYKDDKRLIKKQLDKDITILNVNKLISEINQPNTNVNEIRDKLINQLSEFNETLQKYMAYLRTNYQDDEKAMRLANRLENYYFEITKKAQNYLEINVSSAGLLKGLLKILQSTRNDKYERELSLSRKEFELDQIKDKRSTELRIQFCKEALRDQPWNKGIYKESDELFDDDSEVGNSLYQEEKLTTTERNNLDDDEFGIPSERKYPINDKNHVLQAVRFFNKADEEFKPELAEYIVKQAKKFGLDYDQWNSIKPYLKEYNEEDLI